MIRPSQRQNFRDPYLEFEFLIGQVRRSVFAPDSPKSTESSNSTRSATQSAVAETSRPHPGTAREIPAIARGFGRRALVYPNRGVIVLITLSGPVPTAKEIRGGQRDTLSPRSDGQGDHGPLYRNLDHVDPAGHALEGGRRIPAPPAGEKRPRAAHAPRVATRPQRLHRIFWTLVAGPKPYVTSAIRKS